MLYTEGLIIDGVFSERHFWCFFFIVLLLTHVLYNYVPVTQNKCLQNPCENGGTCIDSLSVVGYECRCPNGYKGVNCAGKGKRRCFLESGQRPLTRLLVERFSHFRAQPSNVQKSTLFVASKLLLLPPHIMYWILKICSPYRPTSS